VIKSSEIKNSGEKMNLKSRFVVIERPNNGHPDYQVCLETQENREHFQKLGYKIVYSTELNYSDSNDFQRVWIEIKRVAEVATREGSFNPGMLERVLHRIRPE
jgi:hypothetical protein